VTRNGLLVVLQREARHTYAHLPRIVTDRPSDRSSASPNALISHITNIFNLPAIVTPATTNLRHLYPSNQASVDPLLFFLTLSVPLPIPGTPDIVKRRQVERNVIKKAETLLRSR
jgi:hypothetical protein